MECGLAFGLNELFELGFDKWQLIKIGQNAEHNFVGTKCGIMDQFASVMGKENHAMLLDCQSLDFEYIPIKLEPYRLLMLNTNVSHNLSTGECNVRREQCEEGLELLVKKYDLESSFRDVSMKMLNESKKELGPIIYDRCSYVVEEIKRAKEAVVALKNDNLGLFGRYMFETHQGLSKKYEVSCPELDFLVALAKTEPQILGARMMGGGFGGCTLNIIHKRSVDDFVNKVSVAHKDKFGIDLSYFVTVPSDGTYLFKE